MTLNHLLPLLLPHLKEIKNGLMSTKKIACREHNANNVAAGLKVVFILFHNAYIISITGSLKCFQACQCCARIVILAT